MGSEWLEYVKSAVPRGFSRYYIIETLKERPHTGKEIIDRATKESDGMWKPSPGLIYPLLGRLLDEGIIAESDSKAYKLTKKGTETSDDIRKIGDRIKEQVDVLLRLGNAGRFVAMDIIERFEAAAQMPDARPKGEIQKDTPEYRQFLIDELESIDSQGDISIKVDNGADHDDDEEEDTFQK